MAREIIDQILAISIKHSTLHFTETCFTISSASAVDTQMQFIMAATDSLAGATVALSNRNLRTLNRQLSISWNLIFAISLKFQVLLLTVGLCVFNVI